MDNCDISKVSGQVSKVRRDCGTDDKERLYLTADDDAVVLLLVAVSWWLAATAAGELLVSRQVPMT